MKDRYKGTLGLFTRSVTIQPHADSPLYLVQKLNDFEMDEARKNAAAWRATVVMALRNEDGDELRALRDVVGRLDRDEMINRLIDAAYTKHSAVAVNAIHADPEWAERLDVLDRVRREEANDEQRTVIDRINSEFLTEISTRIKTQDDTKREELAKSSDDALREEYIESFIDQRAAAAFIREMRYQEVFFGVRECSASLKDDGEWDHTGCSHERIYDDVTEVRETPDELMAHFSRAFDRINVPAFAAKSSASRLPSSEPSRQPSGQEASAPSGPEEKSPAPGGTSS